MMRKHIDDPSEPIGALLCARKTISLLEKSQCLFEFFKNVSLRVLTGTRILTDHHVHHQQNHLHLMKAPTINPISTLSPLLLLLWNRCICCQI
uniref:Putative ovule protein n=1 Tax=Solanum chacoense TaxID=4108 RepID=A0A0V0HN58_SOLCH